MGKLTFNDLEVPSKLEKKWKKEKHVSLYKAFALKKEDVKEDESEQELQINESYDLFGLTVQAAIENFLDEQSSLDSVFHEVMQEIQTGYDPGIGKSLLSLLENGEELIQKINDVYPLVLVIITYPLKSLDQSILVLEGEDYQHGDIIAFSITDHPGQVMELNCGYSIVDLCLYPNKQTEGFYYEPLLEYKEDEIKK